MFIERKSKSKTFPPESLCTLYRYWSAAGKADTTLIGSTRGLENVMEVTTMINGKNKYKLTG